MVDATESDSQEKHGYIFITRVGEEPELEELQRYESVYIKKLVEDHNAGKLKIVACTRAIRSSIDSDIVADCSAHAAEDGKYQIKHAQFSTSECEFHGVNNHGAGARTSEIQLHELSAINPMPGGLAILQFDFGLPAAIAWYESAEHQKSMVESKIFPAAPDCRIFRDVRLCEGPLDLFKPGSGYWLMKVHKVHSLKKREKYLGAYGAVLAGGGFSVEYSLENTLVQEKMRPVFGWPMVAEKRETAALRPGDELYDPSRGFGCPPPEESTLFFPKGRAPPAVSGAETWTDSAGIVGLTQLGSFDRATSPRNPVHLDCIGGRGVRRESYLK